MKFFSRYIDPRRAAPLVIIVTFMIVTVGHVAAFSGSFESELWRWLGWPYAIAVDIAIIICAYFTEWKTTRLWAWAGYFLFTGASGVMNAAAIQPWQQEAPFPAWVYALFPTIAIALLGFLYRSVDSLVQRKEQKRSGDQPAKKSATSEVSKTRASKASYTCEICGRPFRSQPALNAHQRAHVGNENSQPSLEPAEAGTKTLAQTLEDLGRTADFLRQLVMDPAQTHTDLAAAMGVAPQTASYHLQKLEEAGLIDRSNGSLQFADGVVELLEVKK